MLRRVSGTAVRISEPVPAVPIVEAAPTPARSLGKGFAAFLLGVTLGMSFIVIGQSAFSDLITDGQDLFSSPPVLRP
ncbi:MAG: hypothetical protein ACOYOJ_22870 [Alsobacter sp.]